MRIIGRRHEQKELTRYLQRREADFLVVYGRRRVGKTFLLREFFRNDIVFEATGMAEGRMADQLQNFSAAIRRQGGAGLTPTADWFTAFENLRDLTAAAATPARGKKVIFLDEMPWMNTPRSRFLSALEHFWNSWASAQPDILLVVCGSATSWLMKNLLKNRRGLHHRVTGRLVLQPFTLGECEEFCSELGLPLTRKRILDAYMIFGGVPFYLRLLRPDLSLEQNIDELCFRPGAPLADELSELYHSLFAHAENYLAVVAALTRRSKGLTREEIIAATGLPAGGGVTTVLNDLETCGFTRTYHDFTKPKQGAYHQLVDPFTIFALRYLTDRRPDGTVWLDGIDSPERQVWSGYAFERACLLHIDQIKAALGITGVSTHLTAWRSMTTDPGAQIDLIIDRRDQTINLCEMKYSGAPYVIDKAYAMALRTKRAAFQAETGTKKDLHVTMVTTFGVVQGKNDDAVTSQVTMDDLFR